IAGSIGLAVAANAIGPHRVTDGQARPAMPRYYFEMNFTSPRGASENLVRSVATGAVTGRVICPPNGPRSQAVSAAADSHRTFFIACMITPKKGSLSTRVYRFDVSGSGRVSGFRLLPGGTLPKVRGLNMAVSADGSLVAIVDLLRPEVIVIN